MNRKQFFDRHAHKWDSYLDKTVLLRIEKYIVPALRIKRSDKILDVGSGTGIILPYLKKAVGQAGEVVALDYSGIMLMKAREKYGDNFKYVRANAGKTPFSECYFDAVVCFSVFPHFVDKPGTMKELYRILKRGGNLTVAHADSRDTINNHHRKVGSIVEKDIIPDNEQMLSLMRDAGFKNANIDSRESYYIACCLK